MDHPSRRCFCSEWDLYCVSTRTRRSPECRQLLSVKSMMRYRSPKGHGRLGPFGSQWMQARTNSAREYDADRLLVHEDLQTTN